jgi:hypothetical protein
MPGLSSGAILATKWSFDVYVLPAGNILQYHWVNFAVWFLPPWNVQLNQRLANMHYMPHRCVFWLKPDYCFLLV